MTDPLSPTPLSEDMRALIASGELPEYRDVLALCDEVDRLRALADPAPLGLSQAGYTDEAIGPNEARMIAMNERLVKERDELRAEVDRLSAAPVDDRERLAELEGDLPQHIIDGFDENRVWMGGEWWEVTSWHGQADADGQYEALIRRVPVSPSVDPEKEP